jgi:DNA polymerase III epsilon subunit-like protein
MSLICVIDLETSGLDPRECGVMEMGAVMLQRDLSPVGEWSSLVRVCEWQRWEADAERVHGVTRVDAMSADRPSAPVALADFLRFVDSHSDGKRVVLAGMNLAGFDVQFLKAILERVAPSSLRDLMEADWRWLISHRTIDIHALAAGIGLAEGLNLAGFYTDGIYKMLGMDAEPKPHQAITGARMEAEALRRLVALMGKGASL